MYPPRWLPFLCQVEKPFANINWEFDQKAARRKAEAKRKADLAKQKHGLTDVEMGKLMTTGKLDGWMD